MTNVASGLKAGFIATLVLSALMIVKSLMGLMPQLNVIEMLSDMMDSPLIVGWVAHFFIGTVIWGGLFASLYRKIPGGSGLVKGVIFSVGAWLLMMVLVMPMAGAGLFGLSLGIMAPVMTLVLHIIFGIVLGTVYGPAT